jgi:DNA repair protein RadC
MLAHKHPDHTATPISEDRELLRRWRKSGDILGIPILDLVTVTEDDFVSLKHKLDKSFIEPRW